MFTKHSSVTTLHIIYPHHRIFLMPCIRDSILSSPYLHIQKIILYSAYHYSWIILRYQAIISFQKQFRSCFPSKIFGFRTISTLFYTYYQLPHDHHTVSSYILCINILQRRVGDVTSLVYYSKSRSI